MPTLPESPTQPIDMQREYVRAVDGPPGRHDRDTWVPGSPADAIAYVSARQRIHQQIKARRSS